MTDQPNPYEPSQTPDSSEQHSSRFMWNVLTAIPSGLFLCLFSGWYESSADFVFYLGITQVVFGFGGLTFLFIRKKFRG
ncbi:hypothetical protein OAG82_03675 [Rubripirellula sp.]|nr:hypothetical protein [Rubripirellula sp.]MDB4621936.1 hypothetical protein [Rubripirellula sp.]